MGMVKRVVDAVRQFIGRVTGKPVEAVSDGEVLGLIRRMKDAVGEAEQSSWKSPPSQELAGIQRVAVFWKAVASNPNAFKFGNVQQSSVSPEDIAGQISTAETKISGMHEGDGAWFGSDNGVLHVFPANNKRNSEGGFAEYKIQSPAAGSAGKKDGGGAALYQAAQRWISANGGKFVGDDKLTEINKLRVTSNMLSSALRENSTSHLDPDKNQGIVEWKEGDTENNVAALAIREMEVSHERIPELNDLRYDPGISRIVDASGKVVLPFQIRALLQRTDPEFAQGVGVATASRAIATRAALRGEGIAGSDGRGGLLQSGVAFGDTKPLYSKASSNPAKNQSQYGTLTAEQEKAISNVVGKPKTLIERAKEFSHSWKKNSVQGIFDQYAPIKEYSMSAYIKARMSKGSASTLEAIFMYGKPILDANGDITGDFSGKNGGKNGFASVLAPLDGEHDRFLLWVAAQRAERLKSIGLENLWTQADIKSLKTLNDGKLQNGKDRMAAYANALKGLVESNQPTVNSDLR